MYGYIYNHTFLIIFLFFMALPNRYFENFPIEFKEINPADFEHYNVEENRKFSITPNEDGYISDEISNTIDVNSKNTVVINAPVGCGKSYAVIEQVKQFYEDEENYLIFIASPFVSLVEQYYQSVLSKGIPEDDVFRYENISRNNRNEYKNKKIHIITVNTLLGNPGENSLINSAEKRVYINSIKTHCIENHIRVVFIYDEIHDAIHNFKEKFIFNLWKWKNVIHKNIIISATFNEASKVVIRYLAELTNKNIQIIECPRISRSESQSQLFLHFNPEGSIGNDTPFFVKLVKSKIEENKEIDILTYSKKLADTISKSDTGVGELLKGKYPNINTCTSQTNSNADNRFSNEVCNIGTNFKSGISITKDDHAFIIIVSPRKFRSHLVSFENIFSSGLINIIQAIARQRVVGEIHVILPNPPRFNYDSLGTLNLNPDQLEQFKSIWEDIALPVPGNRNTDIDYVSINSQFDKMKSYYEDNLEVSDEIELVNSLSQDDRRGAPRLQYPDIDMFILNEESKFLRDEMAFFSGNLSSYITYCAITNQFVNCRFTDLFKYGYSFISGNIQEKLHQLLQSSVANRFYNENVSFTEIYNRLYHHFFRKIHTSLDGRLLSPYKAVFCRELLSFINANTYNVFIGSNSSRVIDDKYNISTHLFLMMSYAETANMRNTLSYNHSENSNLVNAYLRLIRYRDNIIREIQEHDSVRYFKPLSSTRIFDDVQNIKDVVIEIYRCDQFIRRKIVSFMQNINRLNDNDNVIKVTFYNCLIHTVSKVGRYQPNLENGRGDFYKLDSEIFELNNNILNFE